jgi:ATP-binding cassette subfamily B protein
MKLLFSYLKNYKGLIAITLLLATINQCFSMMDPYILGKIIDKYVKHHKEMDMWQYLQGVAGLVGLAIGAAMVSRIAKNFQDYFLSTITLQLGARIYQDGLKHSLELPFHVFEDQRSGETLGILQKVRTDVEKLISAFVNILFTSIVGIVFVITVSILTSWFIGPLYILSIPILAFVSSALSKKVKKVQKRIVGATTALAGSTTESLRNIELVKSMGLGNQEIDRLNNTTTKILGLELQKVKHVRSISFIQGTIVNFLRNTILFLMMFLIFKDQLTEGQFLMFFIYSFFIFGPLQELGNLILIYREAEVSLENLQRILNTPVDHVPKQPEAIDQIKTFAFQNVSFKHQTAQSNALSNITFETSLGNTIAFVGPSGSGKTTLVKLLVGLYKPQEGAIMYNNISGTEIDFNDLRSQIGFVTQDTQLFAGTIRENLMFVNQHATDAQCIDVLQKAACNSLLQRADKGLDTMIGEGGVKVSGGEKQRLSIARALLRKPDLLVFDEATSALDSITEEEISQTIRNISDGRNHITILIAHRLSTIMHADKIYVLERGQIIESGNHQSLLNEKGLYYAMWRQQIGEKKLQMS